MANKNVKLKDGNDILYPQTKISNIINDDGTPFEPTTEEKVNELINNKIGVVLNANYTPNY